MDNIEKQPSMIDKQPKEQTSNKTKKPSEVMGILHKYANPELIPLEEGAWERDIVDRIKNGDDSF